MCSSDLDLALADLYYLTQNWKKAEHLLGSLELNKSATNYPEQLLKIELLQLKLDLALGDWEQVKKRCQSLSENMRIQLGNEEIRGKLFLQCAQSMTIREQDKRSVEKYYLSAWNLLKTGPKTRERGLGSLTTARGLFSYYGSRGYKASKLNVIMAAIEQASEIALEIDDQLLLSDCFGLRGLIQESRREFGQALGYYRAATRAAQKVDRAANLYRWQWFGGRSLAALNEPNLAIISYRNAVKTLEKTQSSMLLSDHKFLPKTIFETSIEPVYYELKIGRAHV